MRIDEQVFTTPPVKVIETKNRKIYVFDEGSENIDKKTVESFGDEWNSFHFFTDKDIRDLGDLYFDIVDEKMLNASSTVLEVGCGSGRFLKYLSKRAGTLIGADPSTAIFAADQVTGKEDNIQLVKASASSLPFPDGYFDFVYSIGVLHHIPDTQRAMKDCISKLKPGGYFLTYLYYNLDNRGVFFRTLFHISNFFRKGISQMPQGIKKFICDLLAIFFYMPFVLLCRFLRLIGVPEKFRKKIPLFGYESRSFYVIRNDALDRFGTPLEQRFSRKQIGKMMAECGLDNIVFSEELPYWHATGRKK